MSGGLRRGASYAAIQGAITLPTCLVSGSGMGKGRVFAFWVSLPLEIFFRFFNFALRETFSGLAERGTQHGVLPNRRPRRAPDLAISGARGRAGWLLLATSPKQDAETEGCGGGPVDQPWKLVLQQGKGTVIHRLLTGQVSPATGQANHPVPSPVSWYDNGNGQLA